MKIDKISVPITALLGQTTLSLEEYGNLQEGDIVVLDQAHDQKIIIKLGEQNYYLGRIGSYKTQKAVILDERVYT